MLPGRILFDDLFDDDIDVRKPQGMLCDIYEKDNTYHIDIDAPGFKKEDIKIECDKGQTHCEFEHGDFFEACCILSTLIQKLKEFGIDDTSIRIGIESAMECGKDSKNE